MLKKAAAAVLAFAVVFSPIGSQVFNDQTTIVSAKGYKSGVKRYNSNRSTPSKSKQNNTYNKSSSRNSSAKSKSRGFMGGLMYGGIAGLLFGGMLASLGPMGPLFGMILNILGILLIISLVKRIFFTRRNRYNEDQNQWRK
ncbi:hypothetical protein [Mesobacillus zeae]|uniref:Preprotein translocase subunit Tim44 n=1 Tax=Mesobacillus zeae TaxID=1917180 RepID=A0A398BDF4_9BACI|nr:hypothetical protein [Mesobacillus zeae]RID85623.1 hypothetical protein D1970_08695 [Mesobacillus zeae]